MNRDDRRNASGCMDLTSYDAIKKIEAEEEARFQKLLHMIFDLCELSDFKIKGRIVLIDKKTGRIWK